MPICKSWSAVGSNWKDIENIDANRSRDVGSSHEQPIGRLIVVLVHYFLFNLNLDFWHLNLMCVDHRPIYRYSILVFSRAVLLASISVHMSAKW